MDATLVRPKRLATGHIILRLEADQLLGVLDVPAHASVGGHAVDDGKAQARIGFDTASHEVAEIPIGKPHEAKPRAALRRNILWPV